MLVLSRKKNESIIINNDITVTVVEIRGDKVRLGIVAPKEVPVHRQEVYEAIHGPGTAAPAAPVVMAALVVTATTVVLAVAARAALQVPTWPLPMAATSLPAPVAPTQPPLSAFVKQTRPLQQRTEKENKTCCNLLAANIARSKKAATLASQPGATRWRSVISV